MPITDQSLAEAGIATTNLVGAEGWYNFLVTNLVPVTLGNIVGADVLNCLFVIGASAAASPLEIPHNFFVFHFPAMLIILFSFRAFITMNRDGVFKRWQGAWLLGIYLVYLGLQYGSTMGKAAG